MSSQQQDLGYYIVYKHTAVSKSKDTSFLKAIHNECKLNNFN